MKVFLTTFVLMAYVCLIVAVVGFNCSFDTGYYKAAQQQRLYYETTGEFPAEDWLKVNRHNEFTYPQQILDTLKPF